MKSLLFHLDFGVVWMYLTELSTILWYAAGNILKVNSQRNLSIFHNCTQTLIPKWSNLPFSSLLPPFPLSLSQLQMHTQTHLLSRKQVWNLFLSVGWNLLKVPYYNLALTRFRSPKNSIVPIIVSIVEISKHPLVIFLWNLSRFWI